MDRIRVFWTNIIVIALSMAFLTHFILIAIHKTIVIQEPILIILALEIVMLLAFIGFAIFNIIKLRREH